MAFPVAAHTFDFVRSYVSTRDGAAPGSGTWSNPQKIFDGWSDPGAPGSAFATTFSAGALTGDLSEPRGIICKAGSGGSDPLMFLGDGLPDLPKEIVVSGIQYNSLDYWDMSQGAWNLNGSFYIAVVDQSVSPNKLQILKSSDDGDTWSIADSASAPDIAHNIGAMQRVDDVVYFFTQSTVGGDYAILSFDLATELWQPSVATLLAVDATIDAFTNSNSKWSNGLFLFPNGDFGVFYSSSATGTPVYRLYSGSWGAEVVLPAVRCANSVIDPGLALIHVWTYEGGSGVDVPVHYSTVTHAGTVTADIFVIPAPVGPSVDGVGKCSIQESMIFCPRDDSADFDNAVWVALLSDGQFQKELLPIPSGESEEISTASLNAGGSGYAVFNLVTVNGGINPCELIINSVATGGEVTGLTGTGGTGYSTASNVATTTGGGQPGVGTGLRLDITSVSGGAVTGVALSVAGSGYAVNDTGTISGGGGNATYIITAVHASGEVLTFSIFGINGGGYSVASGVSTTNVSGAGTGFKVNIDAVSGKEPSCAYMMFPNGYSLTPPTPPTLACPVDGGSGEVGVAYSKTLVRTGGTGPFTFSIIAGSLPPGLTLNASTGEIHGTPNTAGTFCYTAQVTDSNDLTATVDCCITIINGPIAACPTGDPRIGVAFSVAIPVSGGTEPYTFELTSGALPTGLSLNTSTGVISGTPSAYGTFSYTILITDANGATVTISCSYVIVDPARTLRWQCASPGRPGRWFPHQYAAPVLTHYLVEPNENAPNDQELFMLAGGAILVSGGDTDAGAPITVTAEPGSIDLGDERAQKLYVDAMTEADQTGNISAQIRFNNSQQTGPTLILSPSGPREQFLENIASLSDLSLYRNISVRYSWTGGPDGPRIYAFEPSSYLQPYLSTFLVTQFINLSFPAWKHHRRMYPALISNAPVIFTIKTQDGRSFITTIPSTGGQYRIIPLIVAHGCKQLAFAYQLDGQGTPFALFPESFTVETKSWDEATFIDLAVFKT